MRNRKRAVAALLVALAVFGMLFIAQPSKAPDSPVVPYRLDSPLPAGEIVPRYLLPAVYGTPLQPQARNLDFEAGRWLENRWWWWPSIFWQSGVYPEVQPGEGWTAWWVEHAPTGNTYTGRPEVKVVALDEGFPAAYRIAEGSRALQWFQFWRTGWGGVYQVMMFPAGTWRVGVQAHAWYSNCDNSPEAPVVLDYDCQTEVQDARLWFNAGVDVWGRENYYDAVYGEDYEQYGMYSGEYIYSPWFRLTSEPENVTVWLQCRSNLPLKHGDCYFDDVVIERWQ